MGAHLASGGGPRGWLAAVVLLFVPAVLAAAPAAPVADAAMRGDLAAVRTLLRQGADVNAAQGDGMTALHWAAYNDEPELAAILLVAGANVEARTRLGDYTPLHLAAARAGAEVVTALLEAGADPSAPTSTGGALPLHFAAAGGSAAAVAALIDRGADANAREGVRGQTPLMFAAAHDRVEAIEALVARGADVAATTRVIDIPARELADRADQRGEAAPTPAQEQLYAPNEEEPLSYADLVGAHGGLTALLHAAREGHADAVAALLAAGADINKPSAGDGTPPMLMATLNGHFDLALAMLEQGADPRLASDAGTTPLYAALNLHWAPKSRYPQQHAYRQQRATYLEVMRALMEAGVDPNARLNRHLWYMSFNFDLLDVDTMGATPFWRAAYALDVEAMRLLVAHGADPSIPTAKPPQRFRRTRDSELDPSGLPPVPVGGPAVYPIHAASGVGYGQGFAANAHRHVPDGWLPAIRYLVEELGADVNARDLNGYAPVHHAAARGDNELIRYLVAHGADVTAVSRSGQTTADMANGPVQRIQPFPETVALLEQLGAKNSHNCVSC
jgi:ankyrin repeat protein